MFKAAFALGAHAHGFSGSFAGGFLKRFDVQYSVGMAATSVLHMQPSQMR